MKTYMTAGTALLMTTGIAAAGGIDRSNQFLGPLFEEGGDSGSYGQV
jgi:long-chain fatty acid transport protein